MLYFAVFAERVWFFDCVSAGGADIWQGNSSSGILGVASDLGNMPPANICDWWHYHCVKHA